MEGAGCPWETPQHSRVVAVPLVPAPQVGEQGEGSAGGDADRHLDAKGEELVLLQRVHPHLGEHRARGWDAFTAAEPPLGCPGFGGARSSVAGKGQGFVPFPFPWRAPSWLWLRASSAQRRCCSSDKPGAGATRQGWERGGGGAGGSDSRGAAPYLVALVPGHGERHLGLFAGDDVFSAGKEQFPLRWDTNHPQTVPVSQCRAPPPPFSLLHPRIPLAFSAHRSSRIFFLALASLYLLTPS